MFLFFFCLRILLFSVFFSDKLIQLYNPCTLSTASDKSMICLWVSNTDLVMQPDWVKTGKMDFTAPAGRKPFKWQKAMVIAYKKRYRQDVAILFCFYDMQFFRGGEFFLFLEDKHVNLIQRWNIFTQIYTLFEINLIHYYISLFTKI